MYPHAKFEKNCLVEYKMTAKLEQKREYPTAWSKTNQTLSFSFELKFDLKAMSSLNAFGAIR